MPSHADPPGAAHAGPTLAAGSGEQPTQKGCGNGRRDKRPHREPTASLTTEPSTTSHNVASSARLVSTASPASIRDSTSRPNSLVPQPRGPARRCPCRAHSRRVVRGEQPAQRGGSNGRGGEGPHRESTASPIIEPSTTTPLESRTTACTTGESPVDTALTSSSPTPA